VPAGARRRPTRLLCWRLDRAGLRAAAVLFLCGCVNDAGAQLSGTLSAVSDYRYRGSTLSDRMPALQAGVSYDDPRGWYAGAFGSTVRLTPPRGPRSHEQTIAYAGYALRVSPGFNVEAGGTYSAFAGASDLGYGEAFVGASTDTLNARLYYSPRYFGGSSSSLYAEIDAAQPMFERVRLQLHVGLLRYRYESAYGIALPSERMQHVFDARIGVRIDLDPFQLEIAWVGVSNHAGAYLITGSTSPNSAVAALSLAF
jgi:uncharacterized protein (TIGR02001 family)